MAPAASEVGRGRSWALLIAAAALLGASALTDFVLPKGPYGLGLVLVDLALLIALIPITLLMERYEDCTAEPLPPGPSVPLGASDRRR